MDLDRIFHLKENHTDVKTEVMAGVTSFMTMAYILAVNPNILSAAGMDHGPSFPPPPSLPSWEPCAWPCLPTTPLPWHPAWA